MKTCTKCGDEKPFDQFHRNAQNPDGLHHHCRSCRGSKRRKYETKATHAQPLEGEALRQAVIKRIRQLPRKLNEDRPDVTRWFSRGARLDDELIPEFVQDFVYEVYVRSRGVSPSEGVITLDRTYSIEWTEKGYGSYDELDAMVYGYTLSDDENE